MSNTVQLLRSTVAGNKPASLASGVIAINEADGRLWYRNGSGTVTPLPSVVSYATTASFPATGLAGLLFLASDTSKLYRWESTVYVEVASVATSVSAADLTLGTLPDARLSASVVLTGDSRLSDSRTPTDGSVTTAKLADGSVTTAKIASTIATYATLAATANQSSSALDVYPRGEATSGSSGGTSGQIFFIFFTPAVSFTVSSITFCSGTIAGSGLTLARMGLYTYDETTVTLVARTASDTTLFAATNTAYTRSLATAGGYPATYTLAAGSRYAAAVIAVGTTAPNFAGRTIVTAVGGQTPRMAASLSSQTDLVTTGTPGNAQANIYARLT